MSLLLKRSRLAPNPAPPAKRAKAVHIRDDEPPPSPEPAVQMRLRIFGPDDEEDGQPGEQQKLIVTEFDDGKMVFDRTSVFDFLKQQDASQMTERSKKLANKSSYDQLRQEGRDQLKRAIERKQTIIEKHKLISRDDALQMLSGASINVAKKKAERMETFMTFAKRVNDLARAYLQPQTQGGEEASLDTAQSEIVSDIALSVAPFIFGDVWEQCKYDLFQHLNITGIKRWTAILLARQFGKTLLTSLICAQLLIDCPKINIIVFSVTQTSANRLLRVVKECLAILVGKNTNWIAGKSKGEIRVVQPGVRHKYPNGKSSHAEERTNRITAVSGKVDGSLATPPRATPPQAPTQIDRNEGETNNGQVRGCGRMDHLHDAEHGDDAEHDAPRAQHLQRAAFLPRTCCRCAWPRRWRRRFVGVHLLGARRSHRMQLHAIFRDGRERLLDLNVDHCLCCEHFRLAHFPPCGSRRNERGDPGRCPCTRRARCSCSRHGMSFRRRLVSGR